MSHAQRATWHMTESAVHELRITTDSEFDIPQVWFNFVMHVNNLSQGSDYHTYYPMINQELVKWQGSRHKVGYISFPDAEHLTAFVLAWS